MSALNVEARNAGNPRTVDHNVRDGGTTFLPSHPSNAGDQWLLVHERPASSLFSTMLDTASRSGRLGRLPGDLLIGLPLALAGRAVSRVERVRTWASER